MRKRSRELSTEQKAFKKKSPAICEGFFVFSLLFCVETVGSADGLFSDIDTKFLKGIEVGFLKDDGAMDLAAFQFWKLLEGDVRKRVAIGLNGKSDENLFGVEPWVVVVKRIDFEVLDWLDDLWGDKRNLIVDFSEGLKGVEKDGGRRTE